MDINDFKKQSEKSYGIALAKQNALEKARSRMIMAYEGHLFLANAETINLVKTLSELNTSPFYILDTNDNPVEITDPKILLEKLITKNQEVLNTYHETYKQFATLR